jgi:hypothetical protein
MKLPVLFRHDVESGVIARVKQYEIKAHEFLVDLEEDAKAFIELGYQVIREGADEKDAPKEKAAASKEKKAAK